MIARLVDVSGLLLMGALPIAARHNALRQIRLGQRSAIDDFFEEQLCKASSIVT